VNVDPREDESVPDAVDPNEAMSEDEEDSDEVTSATDVEDSDLEEDSSVDSDLEDSDLDDEDSSVDSDLEDLDLEEAEDDEADEEEDDDDDVDDDLVDQPQRRERLQKVLAAAGIASRRACEELIVEGRVEVDGKRIRELGFKVDPFRQSIEVDGQKIKIEQKVYWLVNKPARVLSTSRDTHGRATVLDLIPDIGKRVFAVGRLDEDTTGLLLLTNDGDLALKLTHPRYGVPKTYLALVAGKIGEGDLAKIRRGVHLAEGKAKPKSVKRVGSQGSASWVEIVLAEGRNREIRRIFAALGHKVMSLERIAIAGVRLRRLRPGESRPATQDEVGLLKEAAGGKQRRGRHRPLSLTPTVGPKRRPGKPDPKFAKRRRPNEEQSGRSARPPGGRGAGSTARSPGVRPARRPGQRPPRPAFQGEMPARPPRPGTRPPGTGIRPPRPAVPGELGGRPARPGARPPGAGNRPARPSADGSMPPRGADRPPRQAGGSAGARPPRPGKKPIRHPGSKQAPVHGGSNTKPNPAKQARIEAGLRKPARDRKPGGRPPGKPPKSRPGKPGGRKRPGSREPR
jgi:23S rRNA pseudouridine2605 synthase